MANVQQILKEGNTGSSKSCFPLLEKALENEAISAEFNHIIQEASIFYEALKEFQTFYNWENPAPNIGEHIYALETLRAMLLHCTTITNK